MSQIGRPWCLVSVWRLIVHSSCHQTRVNGSAVLVPPVILVLLPLTADILSVTLRLLWLKSQLIQNKQTNLVDYLALWQDLWTHASFRWFRDISHHHYDIFGSYYKTNGGKQYSSPSHNEICASEATSIINFIRSAVWVITVSSLSAYNCSEHLFYVEADQPRGGLPSVRHHRGLLHDLVHAWVPHQTDLLPQQGIIPIMVHNLIYNHRSFSSLSSCRAVGQTCSFFHYISSFYHFLMQSEREKQTGPP